MKDMQSDRSRKMRGDIDWTAAGRRMVSMRKAKVML